MKRILSVVLSAFMLLPLFSSLAFATQIESEKTDALVISDVTEQYDRMTQHGWNAISPDAVSESLIEAYDNFVLTCDSLIGLPQHLKTKLVSKFDNGARIVIMGKAASEYSCGIFGVEIDCKDVPDEAQCDGRLSWQSENTSNKIEVDVSAFDSLGVLIYKDIAGLIVTEIKIEDISNDKMLADGLMYCLSYDYSGLAFDSETHDRGGYTNSWINVAVKTATYLCDRCTITTSIKLDKNSGNPNSNNQYLQYLAYKVDIDVSEASGSPDESRFSIRRAEVEAKGGPNSKIYDYGPKNQNVGSSGSLSFSLPFSIGVSFSTESRVAISRTKGGIDSNDVAIQYQPKTVIWINGYEYDGIHCEAHTESYQQGTSYYYGYGTFRIDTYAHYSYSGDPHSLISYYLPGWDTVSGT